MKEKIFKFIDNSESIAVELETELTKRPALSPVCGGEGELEKCEFLENWLINHKITNLERFDAPDKQAKNDIRPNLIATFEGENDQLPRLWIMSHLDVVPPGEEKLWDSDPWTVIKKDGKLIGRGVEDNQQGLVSSVIAVLALLENKLKNNRTVKLLFVADEENGSVYGIDWLLKNKKDLFRKDDLILIPDSGDAKGETLEIAEKNMLWLKVRTLGKQSHASRPDLGNNAHLAGADLALQLHNGLNEKFNARDPLFEPDYSTIQLTKKEANVPNINTIPGEDIFYMDMRILPCYKIDTILSEVDIISKNIIKKYSVDISFSIEQRHESKATPANSPLIGLLSKSIKEVYGIEPKPIGIGGGTVGAFLRNAGIDCVAWSRIDEMAHQPNEYALIKNILDDAKVMALLMMS